MEVQQYYSPLRYPGGKASLTNFLASVLCTNGIVDGVYAEVYAGGAGAALELLLQEHVSEIILNDKDPFVYSFWKAVVNHNAELIKIIQDTPVTITEWEKRTRIIKNEEYQKGLSTVEMGFTAFFLNRCNRSGILKANPIGGRSQLGKWKIDARYNKKELIDRIYRIGFYSDRIRVYNYDAIKFIEFFKRKFKDRVGETLLYLDPPYVINGNQLYRHFYKKYDHQSLAKCLQKEQHMKWLVSYDDNELIHKIYKNVTKNIFEFNYFANRTKIGRELVISSSNCALPESYKQYSREKKVDSQPLEYHQGKLFLEA